MSLQESKENMTHHEVLYPHIPLDTIPALVFMVFILVMNGGVILLIGCSSNIRSTSNAILVSLAVSDFLVGFLGIPLLVACSSTYSSPVCISCNVFFRIISLSTVLHITVITCDRYLYIMWALRYRDIVQRRRVCVILALIWLLSLTSLVRLSWILDVDIHRSKEDLALSQKHETPYLLFYLIVFFLIPTVLMVFLDAQMVMLLRKQYRKITRENLPAQFVRSEKKLQMRQRRPVLRCIALLFFYVICWLPFFILELMQQDNLQIPEVLVTIIYYLRLCPSLFNPLAYAFRKQDLKSKTKRIVYRAFVSNYSSKSVSIRCSTERSLLGSSAHVKNCNQAASL